MKPLTVGIGMAMGAALAVTAISAVYPDVTRRMKRDGKRVLQMGRRMWNAGPIKSIL